MNQTAEPAPHQGTRPTVGVVAVTYSPGAALKPFLTSLPAAYTGPGRLPVVLADNGSDDGAPEAAVAPGTHPELDLRLRPTGGNLGYGAGANAGVAELDPDIEWVLISNPDVELSPGCLDRLVQATRRWPRGGAFGPGMREPDGAVYPSARLLPSLGRGTGHALFSVVWPANPWTRAYRREGALDGVERAVGWLSGACLMLRRSAFDSVGGFDPRFFMYFEDVDLGDRLGRAGWRNVYVPGAEVVHEGGHSTSQASASMLAEHHRSAYRYLADRNSGPARAPLRWALRAGLAARAAMLGGRG